MFRCLGDVLFTEVFLDKHASIALLNYFLAFSTFLAGVASAY
jgi:hypothetical protein